MVISYEENEKIIEPRLSAENFEGVNTKLNVDSPMSYGELNVNILRGKRTVYRAQAEN